MNTVRAIGFVLLMLTIMGCGNNDENKIYTGVIEGTPVNVPALTGGKIVRLDFTVGEVVAAGDTLAVVDTTEFTLQRNQLTARLDELILQSEIARTELERTRTDMHYLEEKKARIAKLVASNSAARQNLDDVENMLKKASSASAAARQNVQRVAAGKKQVTAQIALLEKKIRDAVITSPIGGTATEKYFENGEAIPPMAAIAEIIDLSTVEIKIYVNEQMLPHVRRGQPATIRVDGLDRDLRGHVSWISPKAEFTPKNILTPETRTSLVYAVKVTIPNSDEILKHGMPVEVVLDSIGGGEGSAGS